MQVVLKGNKADIKSMLAREKYFIKKKGIKVLESTKEEKTDDKGGSVMDKLKDKFKTTSIK